MYSRSFIFHRYYPNSLTLSKIGELFWGWSRAVTPHRKEMLRRTFIRKGDGWANSGLAFISSVLFTPLGEMTDLPYAISSLFFPVNCILRIWLSFSLGCRAWHRNLGLIIEKCAFENFQGRPKKDKMRISCDSVSNVHWRSKYVTNN